MLWLVILTQYYALMSSGHYYVSTNLYAFVFSEVLVKSGLQVWLKADHLPAASNFGATGTCVMGRYRFSTFPKRMSLMRSISLLSPSYEVLRVLVL